MSDPGRPTYTGSNPSEEGNGGKLPPISFFASSLPPLKTDIPDLSYFGNTSSYASPNKTYPSPQIMCSPVISSNVSTGYTSGLNPITPRTFGGVEEFDSKTSKTNINSSQSCASNSSTAPNTGQSSRLPTMNKEARREFESVPNSPHLFSSSCLPSPKSVPNLGDVAHVRSLADDHDYQRSNRSEESLFSNYKEQKDQEALVIPSSKSLLIPTPQNSKVEEDLTKKNSIQTAKGHGSVSNLKDINISPKDVWSKVPQQNAIPTTVDKLIMEPKPKGPPRKPKNSSASVPVSTAPGDDFQPHTPIKSKESKQSLLVDLLTSGEESSALINDPYKATVADGQKGDTSKIQDAIKIAENSRKLSSQKSRNDFHAIIEHKPLPPVASTKKHTISPVVRTTPSATVPKSPVALHMPMDKTNKNIPVANTRSNFINPSNRVNLNTRPSEPIQGPLPREQFNITPLVRTRIPPTNPTHRPELSQKQSITPSSHVGVSKHNNIDNSCFTISPGNSQKPNDPSWNLQLHSNVQIKKEKELEAGDFYKSSIHEPPKEEIDKKNSFRNETSPIIPERLTKLFPQSNDLNDEPISRNKKDGVLYKTIIDYLVKENEEYRSEVGRLQNKLNSLQGEITSLMKELTKMINASDDSDTSQETIIDEPKHRSSRRKRKSEKLESADISRSVSPDPTFSNSERKSKSRRRAGNSRNKKPFSRRRPGKVQPTTKKKQSSPTIDEEEVEETKSSVEPILNTEEMSSTLESKIKRTRQRRKVSDEGVLGVSEPKRPRRPVPKQPESFNEDGMSSNINKLDDSSVTSTHELEKDVSIDSTEDQPKTRRSSRRSVRNRFLSPIEDAFAYEKAGPSKDAPKLLDQETRLIKESSVSSESKS